MIIQKCIPVGCVPPARRSYTLWPPLGASSGGGWYMSKGYPLPRHTHPVEITHQPEHTHPPWTYHPPKWPGTRDTHPLEKTRDQGYLPHPLPHPWTETDRHLWKHYFPTTTVAGSNNICFGNILIWCSICLQWPIWGSPTRTKFSSISFFLLFFFRGWGIH